MTTISGTFYWIGDLPDDDDVEHAPAPVFSDDFGEQWQYMATEPVINSICDALRSDETVSDLLDPNPEDHGWYTYLKVDGWTWFLYIQWAPDDDDHENCFEFVVQLCHNWWHRIVNRSAFASRFRALGAAIARAFAAAHDIDDVAFDQRKV